VAILHESKTKLNCAECGATINWYYYVFHEDSEAERYCISCADEWYGQWKEN